MNWIRRWLDGEHCNEEEVLRSEIRYLIAENKRLWHLVNHLEGRKHLAFIKIAIGGKIMQGPVKLTVGQKTKATVLGFDQTGSPWTGTVPQVTYSIDNSTLDSSTPDGSNGDDIVSLAEGVANLTASLTSAEGLALSDSETITNSALVPVLSSIKIDFSTPA